MEKYLLVIAVLLLMSMLVQWVFRKRFSAYSEIQLSAGWSGKEVAEKMLYDYAIDDVQIVCTERQLSDHYNPANKTINLSTDVYHGRSIAAAAVAAHECGHAVQHSRSYLWLGFRSNMVPVVSLSSNILQWVLIFGIMLTAFTGSTTLLKMGMVGLVLITVFSLATLPVELDASRRALLWLRTNSKVVYTEEENQKATQALRWAALTYVVAASGAFANLIYYTSMLFSRK